MWHTEIVFIKVVLLERLAGKNGSKTDCKVREGETTILSRFAVKEKEKMVF